MNQNRSQRKIIREKKVLELFTPKVRRRNQVTAAVTVVNTSNLTNDPNNDKVVNADKFNIDNPNSNLKKSNEIINPYISVDNANVNTTTNDDKKSDINSNNNDNSVNTSLVLIENKKKMSSKAGAGINPNLNVNDNPNNNLNIGDNGVNLLFDQKGNDDSKSNFKNATLNKILKASSIIPDKKLERIRKELMENKNKNININNSSQLTQCRQFEQQLLPAPVLKDKLVNTQDVKIEDLNNRLNDNKVTNNDEVEWAAKQTEMLNSNGVIYFDMFSDIYLTGLKNNFNFYQCCGWLQQDTGEKTRDLTIYLASNNDYNFNFEIRILDKDTDALIECFPNINMLVTIDKNGKVNYKYHNPKILKDVSYVEIDCSEYNNQDQTITPRISYISNKKQDNIKSWVGILISRYQ